MEWKHLKDNSKYVQVLTVWSCLEYDLFVGIVRKDMDVNEHERLSNITLHFTVTVGSSTACFDLLFM